MSLLKKIFGKRDLPIRSYADFWTWFQKNEKKFHSVVESGQHIERDFFDKLAPKLAELKEGFFYLTGMCDENTVELVLTADGNIKNIVFIEELVEHAPQLSGWKFTALKPALRVEDVSIEMDGLKFTQSNLFFYENTLPLYPDEIDISIVSEELNNENAEQITTGVNIFLDNYLGELEFVDNIDALSIIKKEEAQKELIPIGKLKDFLFWRQKEFVEKYEEVTYNTENDEHSIMEAELKSGNFLIAVINTRLLNWNRQPSHPWISIITIKYDGSSNNGMPNAIDYESMNVIEEEILESLIDKDGYLNIGRQTANNEREIYFACKNFRKPAKTFYETQKKYLEKFEIEYEIYKDKYWQTFEKFKPTP